jgi:hypothetical protein
VGTPFQTAFYDYHEWYPHLLVRHSILNLQFVLGQAVWLNPQIWTGYFADRGDSSILMISVAPPAGERAGIVKALTEVKQRELAASPVSHP